MTKLQRQQRDQAVRRRFKAGWKMPQLFRRYGRHVTERAIRAGL